MHVARTRTTGALAVIAVAALAVTTGCSSSKSTPAATGGGSSASPTVDQALVAQLPASVKAKGSISFASDMTYPPIESQDDTGKAVGFDIDLGGAIAAKLGLTSKFTNVTFDNILGGIKSGTFDAGMSAITDNKSREAGGYKMVTYFNAGTKLMVPKGNPKNLSPTDDSLCGLTVGAETGTVQLTDDIPARSKKCVADGKKAITPLGQDKQTDVNTSLSSGRSDAVLADSPVIDYNAKQGPFQAIGDAYQSAPYGIALYNNDALANAILGALKDLQADGTYHKLTAKYGISSGDLTTPGINQATS